MRYIYNTIEVYVNKMYEDIGIYHCSQLVIKTIAAKLGVSIVYAPMESTHHGNVIYLDNRLSSMEQWQDFGHELCHVLWHTGNQLVMSQLYRDYQEWKALSFGMHVCVPTFMLLDLDLSHDHRKAVWQIQRAFQVTHEFAELRYEKFLRQQENQTVYSKIIGF